MVKNISLRISNLSANESIFNNFAPRYNEALARSGHTDRIAYIPHSTRRQRPLRRTRNVVWCNPPYNMNIVNSIGKSFFQILHDRFPPQHQYYQIIKNISLRISNLSANEGIFNDSAPRYNDALARSGFKEPSRNQYSLQRCF